MNNQIKITILISSCDKFSDTWDIVTNSIQKYWLDCPFQIKIITNKKDYNNGSVRSLKIGEDISWSSNLIKAVKSTDADYVFMWLDDVFLSDFVDNYKINEIINFLQTNSPAFLRIRPNPKPDKIIKENFGIIFPESLFYRVSIFASFWRKDALIDLLKEEESAWQFELEGSKRSSRYKDFYVYTQKVFNYIHGIEKGKWKADAVKWLNKNNYKVDFSTRKIMSNASFVIYFIGYFKNLLINLFPGKYRHKVVRCFQKFYVLIGLREKTSF